MWSRVSQRKHELARDTTPASVFTLPDTDQSFCVKFAVALHAAATPNGGSARGYPRPSSSLGVKAEDRRGFTIQ